MWCSCEWKLVLRFYLILIFLFPLFCFVIWQLVCSVIHSGASCSLYSPSSLSSFSFTSLCPRPSSFLFLFFVSSFPLQLRLYSPSSFMTTIFLLYLLFFFLYFIAFIVHQSPFPPRFISAIKCIILRSSYLPPSIRPSLHSSIFSLPRVREGREKLLHLSP